MYLETSLSHPSQNHVKKIPKAWNYFLLSSPTCVVSSTSAKIYSFIFYYHQKLSSSPSSLHLPEITKRKLSPPPPPNIKQVHLLLVDLSISFFLLQFQFSTWKTVARNGYYYCTLVTRSSPFSSPIPPKPLSNY